eukprot:4460181-Pleurochrysis_carterae.AAC.1
MEASDPDAASTFEALRAEFAGTFRALWRTEHVLQPGEVPGKSSNENYAVRWLYKQLALEHDPYS